MTFAAHSDGPQWRITIGRQACRKLVGSGFGGKPAAKKGLFSVLDWQQNVKPFLSANSHLRRKVAGRKQFTSSTYEWVSVTVTRSNCPFRPPKTGRVMTLLSAAPDETSVGKLMPLGRPHDVYMHCDGTRYIADS